MKTKLITISCLIIYFMFLFTNAYANDDIYINSDYNIFVNNTQISDEESPILKSSYSDKLFIPLEPFFLSLNCIVAYCPNKYAAPVFDILTPAGELIRLSENPDNLNIGAHLKYYTSYLYTDSTSEFYGDAVFWYNNTAYIALQDLSKIYNISITYDNNKIFIQKEYSQQESYIQELKKSINLKSYIDENCVDYLRMKNRDPEKTFDNIIDDVNTEVSNDIGCSNWALKDINRVSEKNILPTEMRNAYTENINRYEFSIIAYNLLKMNENISYQYESQSYFNDIDSVEINFLLNTGIINGKSETQFAPYDELSREEAAAILSRMADYLDISADIDNSFKYGDDDNISDWAKEAVYKTTALGIMNGVGNNTFEPQKEYTKEQAIVTIMRLYDIININ